MDFSSNWMHRALQMIHKVYHFHNNRYKIVSAYRNDLENCMQRGTHVVQKFRIDGRTAATDLPTTIDLLRKWHDKIGNKINYILYSLGRCAQWTAHHFHFIPIDWFNAVRLVATTPRNAGRLIEIIFNSVTVPIFFSASLWLFPLTAATTTEKKRKQIKVMNTQKKILGKMSQV